MGLELKKKINQIKVSVYTDRGQAATAVAHRIAKLIRSKQMSGGAAVLGLATGATPIGVYEELVRLHREDGLSFNNVVTFNLDEYYPMDPKAEQSYVTFMNTQFFDHVDIPSHHINIPDGTVDKEDVGEYCEAYEKKIIEYGGLDVQLLGIGRTGHIGFNEPGSAEDSLTRLISLNEVTRQDAAAAFGDVERVPTHAITMGIGTIARAKEIILMAWGEKKAEIVTRALKDEITDEVPATYLQKFDGVEYVLDHDAATLLID